MSALDIIFRKRLKRIREKLNSYIESRLTLTEHKFSATSLGGVSAEKKSGVQHKFFDCMKLCDENEDDYQDDYAYEDECMEECSELSSRDAEPRKPLRIEVPIQPSTHMAPDPAASIPSRSLHIPDFAKRDKEHLELDCLLAKKEESFSEMLLRMIDEKGLKDSDVYKQANIDRRLFSKIRGDENYVPSKKTAISFCLALQLELEEAKKLLATAGYTLSASSRFDLIIMYLIENSEYNIHFANIVLDDYGEGTLSR